jgi:hypothetical protein
MIEMKIEDPDNFQFASTVTKDSKSTIVPMKPDLSRIDAFWLSKEDICITTPPFPSHSMVCPFSHLGDPKVLDYFHELPKSSLDVTKIKKIVTPSKTSPLF